MAFAQRSTALRLAIDGALDPLTERELVEKPSERGHPPLAPAEPRSEAGDRAHAEPLVVLDRPRLTADGPPVPALRRARSLDHDLRTVRLDLDGVGTGWHAVGRRSARG